MNKRRSGKAEKESKIMKVYGKCHEVRQVEKEREAKTKHLGGGREGLTSGVEERFSRKTEGLWEGSALNPV